MSDVRVRTNMKAVRELLHSTEVRQACGELGDEIASEARRKTTNKVVVINAGRRRARTYVRMLGIHAARDEIKHRPLGSSIP